MAVQAAGARRRARRPWGAIAVFLAPALALYGAFVVVPVVMTFYNSVHRLEIYGAVTNLTTSLCRCKRSPRFPSDRVFPR